MRRNRLYSSARVLTVGASRIFCPRPEYGIVKLVAGGSGVGRAGVERRDEARP
jgi:hypothetical protein